MRAVIFGYFGTLTDPGAEEYGEPLAHLALDLQLLNDLAQVREPDESDGS